MVRTFISVCAKLVVGLGTDLVPKSDLLGRPEVKSVDLTLAGGFSVHELETDGDLDIVHAHVPFSML